MNAPLKSATPAPTSPVGKIVVLGIFGVALAAAAFALYWNMSQSRRALEFWGPEAMRRIQRSDKVEILPLELPTADSPEGDFETLEIDSQRYIATRQYDVTKARGLVHARHALTTDASYQSGQPHDLRGRPFGGRSWKYAIRFTDKQGTTVLLLDGERIGYFQGNQEMELIPKVADGWRSFVERETKPK